MGIAKENFYSVNSRSLACKISHSEIVYFHSRKMKTTFHLICGAIYSVSKNIGMVHGEINKPLTFIKIDRSIVINLAHVKWYEKKSGRTIVMKNNHALTVSKREKPKVLKAYFRHNPRTSAK